MNPGYASTSADRPLNPLVAPGGHQLPGSGPLTSGVQRQPNISPEDPRLASISGNPPPRTQPPVGRQPAVRALPLPKQISGVSVAPASFPAPSPSSKPVAASTSASASASVSGGGGGGDSSASTAQMVAIIDRWRECDNRVRALNAALVTQRAEKSAIGLELIRVMETTQIDNINLNSGKIRVVTDKHYKPITKKTLLESLSLYSGVSPEQRVQIAHFVLNNRTRCEETKKIVHTGIN